MAAAIVFTALTTFAGAQGAGSQLPGGASSLQENYETWSLSCQSAPQTVCAISQQQAQRNGQRVLAIELQHGAKDGLSGNLVLPFGLLLDAGVVLQVDEEKPREPVRFLTCLPAGCVARLNFDPDMADALRSGTLLKIKVQDTDQKEMLLSVSLKGFAAALDRLKALSGV
ncbi:invasion associated locus B family protein [Ochrobactrum sp. CM-21-5]|nr:invasion associated locus B family protein [Ochrobactrum sp. CM-21-5]MBC2886910.1 invasion associated locus B family protein [Ochrobactrum sp. CM-21-5]